MPKDELVELRDSIAQIVVAWSQVESAITAMVSQCIGEPEKFEMASAIVFGPTSLDARLAIGSRVFSVAVKGLPDQVEVETIAGRIFKRLGDSKRVRNAVLHGNIVSYGVSDAAGKISQSADRIMPNVFDRIAMDKQWNPPQLPGYSAANVSQSAWAVQRLAGKVNTLGALITSWKANNQIEYAKWLSALRQ